LGSPATPKPVAYLCILRYSDFSQVILRVALSPRRKRLADHGTLEPDCLDALDDWLETHTLTQHFEIRLAMEVASSYSRLYGGASLTAGWKYVF